MRGRATLLALMTLALAACGVPCRDIEARPLELQCDAARGFSGELHFDSEAPFETFLSQQCLPRGSEAQARELIDSIDFTRDAVFVSVGPMQIAPERCLARRDFAGAQVCETGLKVLFDDAYRAPSDICPGSSWTVAFVLKREDLRAALEAPGVPEAPGDVVNF